MQDKNGLTMCVGDEIIHGEKEYYLAGESGDRIVIWSWDFDNVNEMPIAVDPASVVKLQRSILADFLAWILSAALPRRKLKRLRGAESVQPQHIMESREHVVADAATVRCPLRPQDSEQVVIPSFKGGKLPTLT